MLGTIITESNVYLTCPLLTLFSIIRN